MREDMFKVIVERPRRVNSNAYSRDGRHYRNSEDAPLVLGMKKGYGDRKWFNENLAPLRRYLESQIGRPWVKVYGEIRAQIDARSTVKHHILQHLEDFVSLHATYVDGELLLSGGWRGEPLPLHETRFKLFVDPRTGILRRNRHYVSYDRRQREKKAETKKVQEAIRRDLGNGVQLHCIDGIWYRVELGTLPAPRTKVYHKKGKWVQERVFESCRDVLRNEWVSRKHGNQAAPGDKPSNEEMFGQADCYAATKRQLSSKELQKFGLQS